jgi:hypothetical protein
MKSDLNNVPVLELKSGSVGTGLQQDLNLPACLRAEVIISPSDRATNCRGSAGGLAST